MPYRRRYSNKNYRKRRSYKRSSLSSKQKTQVSRMLDKRIEFKRQFYAIAAQNVYFGNPLTKLTLCQLSQGDTVTTREGNRVTLRRIKVHLKMQVAEGEYGRVRYMFILASTDTNSDGATISSYFTGVTPGTFLPSDLPFKYRMIEDKVFNFRPGNGGDISQRIYSPSYKFDHKVIYDGGNANPNRGTPIMIITSDLGNAATNSVQIEGEAKTYYTDG